MILDDILANKRREVLERSKRETLDNVAKRASLARKPLDFKAALQQPGVAIISEIKRQSPAKGALKLDMDASTMAATYAEAGASCISVLTDERFFKGSDRDLEAVRQKVTVPVLRKDFVVSPYQIYEARTLGADAILLIVLALTPQEITLFSNLAKALGLTALVEVHSEEELKVALDLGCDLIGINNRDLTRMVTDIESTARLRPLVPPGVTLVSESGIRTAEDIAWLRDLGVDAALIGESLVTAPDAGELLRSFLAAGGSAPAPVSSASSPIAPAPAPAASARP
ncbi:MAG: indole-3-glycerol phosphate synthase TrpC [Chloroflexota bacterium]